MGAVEKIRKNQQAKGPATILAIGTANPTNCVYQAEYPDYYFRVTKSEHMTALKQNFIRICDKSMIHKRYMHLTEELMEKHPEAALKAIEEWGQPKSKITQIVFCSTSGVNMPGADYQLMRLLGLSPSVKRVMLNHQGCFAGGTVLRIAKDLAENNAGTRVLVISSEITITTFRGPSAENLENLVGQAIFGDGAAALIIGSDPKMIAEQPIFQLVWAVKTVLPNSEGNICWKNMASKWIEQ